MWVPFIDSFNADTELSSIQSGFQKFNYLCYLLGGNAFHAIAGLSVTSEN